MDIIQKLLGKPEDRNICLYVLLAMCPDGIYVGYNISGTNNYWTLLISVKFLNKSYSGTDNINNDKWTSNWDCAYYEDKENKITFQLKKYSLIKKLVTVRKFYHHNGSLCIQFILPCLENSQMDQFKVVAE